MFRSIFRLLVLIWIVPSLGDVKLNHVKFVKDNELKKISLNFNKPIKVKSFKLSSPNRLVLDFDRHINLHLLKQKKSAGVQYRSSDRKVGKSLQTRLVFDLDKAFNYKQLSKGFLQNHSFSLSYGRSSQLKNIKRQQVNENVPVKNAMLSHANEIKRLRKVNIVLDPGHGGRDSGAIGYKNVYEKHIVLSIARKIGFYLSLNPDINVSYTRYNDVFVPLRTRLDIARSKKADLFVSIHADAYMNSIASGASVFALSASGASSEAARWLADKENISEMMGNKNMDSASDSLKSVLIDLQQSSSIHRSLTVGESILRNIKPVAKLHKGSVEQAKFVVLKSPHIPSVLIECGFISNPYEQKKLSNRYFQDKFAKHVANGLISYFQLTPPDGTLLAYKKTTRKVYVKNKSFVNELANKYSMSLSDLILLNPSLKGKITISNTNIFISRS